MEHQQSTFIRGLNKTSEVLFGKSQIDSLVRIAFYSSFLAILACLSGGEPSPNVAVAGDIAIIELCSNSILALKRS